jgi:predicted MFS family arabinose efflux permease
MGLLNFAQFAPGLLLGLIAGVLVDRMSRRRILIASSFISCVVIASVPAAMALHRLTLQQIVLVGFLAGAANILFTVAYRSYLPSLVGREGLTAAYSKLEGSRSIAQLTGPGIAGWFIQVLTPPAAMAVDAASFLVALVTLVPMRASEPAPEPGEQRNNGRRRSPPPTLRATSPARREGLRRELTEGMHTLLGHPLLRPMALAVATSNLGMCMGSTVFVLFLTRQAQISPFELGAIFAIGSVGALAGARLATPAVETIGLGRMMIVGMGLFGAAVLVPPLAIGPPAVLTVVIGAAFAVANCTATIFNINKQSLCGLVVDNRLQGRVNAAILTIIWTGQLVGAAAGGGLGELIGLRATLIVGAAGPWLAMLWLLFSACRNLAGSAATVAESRG